MTRDDSVNRETTRRVFLAGTAAGGVAILAGCIGDEDVPDPITLSDQSCEECNMVINQHPGPVGQAFYDDIQELVGEDRDEDDPAWFCSTTCAYHFVFEQEGMGHEPQVIYITDYSEVDWEVVGEDDASQISAHLEAEHFADVTDLTLVADSDLEGAMGGSIIGFSDGDDAADFMEEHGGVEITHDDVDRELLSAL